MGANFEYNGTTKLISIAFGGTGRIFITRDDNFLKHDTTYAWRIPNKTNPVAYVSGNRPLVEARFSSCKDAVWAKGVASDGHEFPVQKLKIDVVSTGIYEMKASTKIFEKHRVKFYDPFEIVWFLSTDSINFTQIGVSKNPLYVTYDKPIPKSLIDTLPFHRNIYHTAIYYGCKSANGLNDSTKIVEAIYQKTFIDTQRKIKRIDNPTKIAMTYWEGNNITQEVPKYRFDAETLIGTENGSCGNWADLFHRIVINQGIISPYITTVVAYGDVNNFDVLPANLESEMIGDFSKKFGSSAVLKKIKTNFNYIFFVKNWNFAKLNEFYSEKDSIFVFKDSISNPISIIPADSTGVAAQGNNDPRAYFENHALVEFKGKYYDPSYGASAGVTPFQWENSALNAFGTSMLIDYIDYKDRKPKLGKRIHWVKHYNTSKTEVVFY